MHTLHKGPAVCKRGNLFPWAAPVARVPHGPPTTAEIPTGRVRPDQDTHGDGMGRGHGTGSERRLGRQEVRDREDRRGEGERGNHENNLPLGGRVLGQVGLYGERGRGGGRRDTGTTKTHKGPRATKRSSGVNKLGTQRLGLEWPLAEGGMG